jgi:hypothetical protein
MTRAKPFALALLVVLAGLTGAVAAQTDDGPIGDLVDDEDDEWLQERSEEFAFARGVAAGMASNALDRVPFVGDDEEPPAATTVAADVERLLEGNESAIVTYADGRLDPATSYDTVEVTYDIEDDTATHYIVANATDTDWAGFKVVNSTTKTVDESCTLTENAAENAPEELATMLHEFIRPDEYPDSKYVGELTGTYAGQVNCSFEVTN